MSEHDKYKNLLGLMLDIANISFKNILKNKKSGIKKSTGYNNY